MCVKIQESTKAAIWLFCFLNNKAWCPSLSKNMLFSRGMLYKVSYYAGVISECAKKSGDLEKKLWNVESLIVPLTEDYHSKMQMQQRLGK